MTSHLAQIAIDALNVKTIADFWCEVLGWQRIDEDDGEIGIGPEPGSPLGIVVLRVPDAKAAKNRVHLDLRANGTTTEDELRRLMSLGARRVDIGQGPDVSWVVLTDPEGNEFCLLRRTLQEIEASK